jgi:protein ImuB
VRLFGGRRALRGRVRSGAQAFGLVGLAWAPNSLAALALGRAGQDNGFARPLPELLDPLPLGSLSALRPHAQTLQLIGCSSLGALRRLPRAGLARRLDATVLPALDQAYGLLPETHRWLSLPETFSASLALQGRVEQAPALMVGAERLLLQLSAWLAVRHLGVSACTLRWSYDSMRARSVAPWGELGLRTAEPTRDARHLARLLAEHLARLSLPAPVAELTLRADEVHPLAQPSGSLLPSAAQQAETLGLVLERLAARLGPERVQRAVLCEDHRPERMQRWEGATALAGPPGAAAVPMTASASVAPLMPVTPAALMTPAAPVLRAASRPSAQARLPGVPQPTFLLPEPLPLGLVNHRPVYQGPLLLLIGPHRIEGGWWDAAEACRDYWVAYSARAGVLWVFQARLAGPAEADAPSSTGWFLHGFFA